MKEPTVPGKRIHVLHVVRHGFAGGGMENGVVNVANRLPADRWRISICALDSSQTFSERLHTRDSEFHLLPKKGEGIDWTLVRKLAQLFRKSRADLVHSHNWGTFLYAVLAAKIAGVPIVHGEHGKNEHELGPEAFHKRWTKAVLGRCVSRLITVSQELAKEWRELGIPEERIEWIPNGVDSERFCPRANRSELRKKFGLSESGFLFGSIGRMDALKNQALLIDAFAKIASRFPDSQLALMGKGPRENQLRNQARELGIEGRVVFLGHRSDPEDFLAALDCFALSSKFEGMSNVVLEAMATGLPVVCADLPAHAEVLELASEGILVGLSVDAWARAFESLATDEGLRSRLSLAARAKVSAVFTLDKMMQRYILVYEKTLQS